MITTNKEFLSLWCKYEAFTRLYEYLNSNQIIEYNNISEEITLYKIAWKEKVEKDFSAKILELEKSGNFQNVEIYADVYHEDYTEVVIFGRYQDGVIAWDDYYEKRVKVEPHL